MNKQTNILPDNPQIEVIKSGRTGLFTNYIYKAIPLAFDESMSYYETLLGLLHYLKNVILPTVNNNADAVAELQNLYNELHDYVKNYFDNLDVQKEINNKLDEMVASGELETILAHYIDTKITKNYDTINDVIEDVDNLEINQFIYVCGYYSINDGLCRKYKIVNNNDTTINIQLNESLYLQPIYDYLKLEDFGVHANSSYDDSEKIQKAIDYCTTNGILLKAISNKTYYISTKIEITHPYIFIDFCNATIKALNNYDLSKTSLIDFNVHTTSDLENRINKFFKNVTLDASFKNISSVLVQNYLQRCSISNINLIRVYNKGINIASGYEVFYDTIYMNAYNSKALDYGDRIAIDVKTDDLTFHNITAIDFNIFAKVNGTYNYFSNCHAWIATGNILPNSCFVLATSTCMTHLVDCYADTYESVLASSHPDGNFKCINLKTYFNDKFFESLPSLNLYIFKQLNDLNTSFYYFSRTSLINSEINGSASGNNNYTLSNTIRTLMANIDNSNTFNNINDYETNVGDINELNEKIENVEYKEIIGNDIFTHLKLIFRIDNFNDLKDGDYITIGFINNYKLSPYKYTQIACTCYNASDQNILNCRGYIDQAQTDTTLSGRIRIKVNQSIINAKTRNIIIDTVFPNIKKSIH